MNKGDFQLSKSLSWLLRHGAVKESLSISADGYVAVEQVLQHRSLKHKYARGDIERIVNTNSKQRFKLRLNQITKTLEIKANQGHTIQGIDDTELTPVLESKYKTIVHGTYLKFWVDIRKHGLSRMQRKHIHLAKGTLEDKNIISGLRKNVEVYIFVNIKLALNDGIKFYESENGVILTPGNDKGFLETKYFFKVIAVNKGFPGYTQKRELEHVFAGLGAPRVEHMERRSAVLQFRSAADASAALRAPGLMLYGELLKLSSEWRRPARPNSTRRHRDRNENLNRRPRLQVNNSRELELDPTKIDFSGDFHQQLASVLATVRLDQEEVTKISELYADVEDTLQQFWPGCTAIPFGSITSGLGIKTSDADCFVDVPEESRLGESVFVVKAKKLLHRYPGTFRQVVCIPRANTPIVKFFHVTTKTNCDVSFKTPLGVRNSQLIAFLLHVDPRLIPMSVLVKYWGKLGGFTGSGKLTNYALTMLLIFYLQQLAVLPAVSWLQAEGAVYEVDCWNTGFANHYDALPKPKCDASIPELVGGFFQYYSNFNFEDDVISPFLGRTVKKSMFEDLNLLPSELGLYKDNVREQNVNPLRVSTPICIQDPFEQCHNVASVISDRCAFEVKAFFAFAAAAYEQGKNNNYEGFLKTILLEKPILPANKTAPEFRIIMREQELNLVRNPDWQSVVREIAFQIFEYMLKFEFERVVEKKPSESKRTKKEKYVSVLKKTIWKRKQFARVANTGNLNVMEKQARITEEILKNDDLELNIKFQLVLHFSIVKRFAIIALKALDGDEKTFREFGNFFLSVAQHWLQQLLLPHLVPPTERKTPAVANVENQDNNDAEGNVNDEDEITCSSEEDDTANGEAREGVDNGTEPATVITTRHSNAEQGD